MTDEEIVARQIGRRPRGFLRVATRCPLGLPETIVTKPVILRVRGTGVRITPFPTVFWLTCPGAVKTVAELEAAGWIGELQKRLESDPEASEAYRESVRSYADFRKSLLSSDEAAWLAARYPSQYEVVARSGIGGVLGEGGVKCLHAHYADYLARGKNPVGGWVRELLAERQECRSVARRSPACYNLVAERNRREIGAGVAEQADARDLKSLGPCAHAGSIPASGTSHVLLLSR